MELNDNQKISPERIISPPERQPNREVKPADWPSAGQPVVWFSGWEDNVKNVL